MESTAPMAVRSYRSSPLVSVLEHVAEGDPAARDEFHNQRTVFRDRKGNLVLFVPFIESLCESEMERNDGRHGLTDEVIEIARDLTIDKFSRLPDSAAAGEDNGIDCRYYFRAILERYYATRQCCRPSGQIRDDDLASRLLQGHVRWHFGLSLKEAKRRCNPLVSRYAWPLDGKSLYVWLPKRVSGHDRRKLLERIVDHPDPNRPGEKARVQSLIDRALNSKFVTFDTYEKEARAETTGASSLSWAVLYEITTDGLAETVAGEKVQRIEEQRPAIRALGAEKLKSLILEIFERVGTTGYRDQEIAARHCISKPTFSRFAGSRWNVEEAGNGAIPDLWRNTALVISRVPGLSEAARAAGVWSKVKAIVPALLESFLPRRRAPEGGNEMSDDLYFFPILVKAFEEPDALSAMMHAFHRIREMGDLPQYRQGFLQFERFMEEVAQSIHGVINHAGCIPFSRLLAGSSLPPASAGGIRDNIFF